MQLQQFGPTIIKVRKSAIANLSTIVQIKNHKKEKVDGECEIVEHTQRTPFTSQKLFGLGWFGGLFLFWFGFFPQKSCLCCKAG